MAGTATIREYFHLGSLGNLAPLTREFTIGTVDEFNHEYRDLAATTAEALSLGSVNTVYGFVIHLVAGGTTITTGLAVDLEASTYATPHLVLYKGQQVFINTNIAVLSVKNLDSSICTYEYVLIGKKS